MEGIACTMGGKARKGPKETERMPSDIYTISAGVSQPGGLMDRMRLSNTRGSYLQLSGFGVTTCALRAPPRLAGCQKSSPSTKFSSRNQPEYGLSSGHAVDKVKKMAYRSRRQAKKRGVFSLKPCVPPSSQPHACRTSMSQGELDAD